MKLAGKLNLIFGVLTLPVVAFYLMGFQLPPSWPALLLFTALAVTGIPHGAIDHVIYQKNHPGENGNKALFTRFFLPYLGLLTATMLLWWVMPAPMFWFFLLLSAYHFGQSQLFYLNLSEKNPFKPALYIAWGSALLSWLWWSNWKEMEPTIGSLFSWNLSTEGAVYNAIRYSTYATATVTLTLLALALIKGALPFRMWLQEMLIMILLALLIRFCPLYLSIAVYFGIWHALRVILTEYQHLSTNTANPMSPGAFVKAFLPFSLLSFLGVILLFGAASLLRASISPFMLFLVFISALTLPHAFFMQQMYMRIAGRPAAA